MTVVQVFFRPEYRPRPDQAFELVEVDHPDFEQFLIAAAAGGIICGSRLCMRRDPENRYGRIVTRRNPLAFRGTAIERAQLPTYQLVEADS